MQVSGICHCFTFLTGVVGGVVTGGTFLRRIHQGLIDRQCRGAILSAYFVDAQNHLLPYFFDGWQFVRFLYGSHTGVRCVCVDLDAIL